MKVVDDQSTASSWVTIISIAGLIAVGYIAYQHRDRFLTPGPKATPAPARRISEEDERKFFEARDRIVAAKYDEASALLTSIDTDKVPQPTRNWITMQNGATRLLAGKLPEARAEFAKIEQRGLFSRDPSQEKLAAFFVKAAHAAASDEPVKSDVVKDYDLESTEAFAMLIFGLKDWNLGQFEDASVFFREFKSASPPDSEIWLRRYRPLVNVYAESYSAFQTATDAAKDAGDHERREAALKTIDEAKAKLKGQAGLVARLSELEGTLKKQVDTVKVEMSKETAEGDAADQKVIDDVKTRVAAFNEKFNFGDAHQIVFTATVNGDKAKKELEGWFKRTQWLAKFKSTLVSDINANGCAKPLAKRDGTTAATGVKSADDTEVTTPAKAKIAWTDLTPEAIIAMAKDFVTKATEPVAVADRQWLLGNYLYDLHRQPDALELLQEAANAKPEYKDALALFPAEAAK